MSIDLIDATPVDRAAEILTPGALAFVERLHERFAARRDERLLAREGRRVSAATAGRLDLLSETAEVRQADWQVAEVPAALRDHRVEMTGPATPAKMAINALNSGTKVWLADLEDASCPSWSNVVDALLNPRDAVRPNQLDSRHEHLTVKPEDLLDVSSAQEKTTETGLRNNPHVAVAYTAETSRSQLWQQIRNDALLADSGETVTRDLVSRRLDEEVEKRVEVPADQFEAYYRPAANLVRHLCLDEDFADCFTPPAYEQVT